MRRPRSAWPPPPTTSPRSPPPSAATRSRYSRSRVPTADVHRVEVLPSYMVRVSRAQIYLKVGLGLDQWADAIIDGSRNDRLTVVDCSQGVPVLEKPTGARRRLDGRHPPERQPALLARSRNGAIVAQDGRRGAGARTTPRTRPSTARAPRRSARNARPRMNAPAPRTATLSSKTLLTYHRSWSYFANAFGLEVVGNVEPVPGIPPTARHLAKLVSIVEGAPGAGAHPGAVLLGGRREVPRPRSRSARRGGVGLVRRDRRRAATSRTSPI